MLSRRYRLRTLLLTMAGFATALVAWQSFHHYHKSGTEREFAAIEQNVLDIYGYSTESTLPKWLSGWMPAEMQLDFEHITEID